MNGLRKTGAAMPEAAPYHFWSIAENGSVYFEGKVFSSLECAMVYFEVKADLMQDYEITNQLFIARWCASTQKYDQIWRACDHMTIDFLLPTTPKTGIYGTKVLPRKAGIFCSSETESLMDFFMAKQRA